MRRWLVLKSSRQRPATRNQQQQKAARSAKKKDSARGRARAQKFQCCACSARPANIRQITAAASSVPPGVGESLSHRAPVGALKAALGERPRQSSATSASGERKAIHHSRHTAAMHHSHVTAVTTTASHRRAPPPTKCDRIRPPTLSGSQRSTEMEVAVGCEHSVRSCLLHEPTVGSRTPICANQLHVTAPSSQTFVNTMRPCRVNPLRLSAPRTEGATFPRRPRRRKRQRHAPGQHLLARSRRRAATRATARPDRTKPLFVRGQEELDLPGTGAINDIIEVVHTPKAWQTLQPAVSSCSGQLSHLSGSSSDLRDPPRTTWKTTAAPS